MLTEAAAIAKILGIATGHEEATPFLIIGSIERGFPVTSLDRVADLIAPDHSDFKYRFVPKATLARRRRGKGVRLTAEESDRLARIAKVWAHAVDVWHDDEKARAFLFRSHPMLEGRRPIDAALSTEMGAELVDQILGRLEYGSAA
jgi:putative toxin-antitoxin system antitoxin component (TIGR02293 family)